jgi:uncharacterized membrane protein YccC
MAAEPTPSRPSSRFWRTVIRFDASKIAPEIAIRNTIGIVLPLIAGAALGNVAAGAVGALGALNVSYSDSRDPYSIRARRMLGASVFVGLAVFIGALSGRNNAAAVMAGSLWAFGAGMLVVLGLKAGNLGVTTLVTLVVFAARPMGPLDAAETGLVAFAGALLQTGLAIAFWPVRPYGPERQIVGALYAALSQVARSASAPALAPPASAQITEAREALATLAGDHAAEAERYVFLLSQAERIRLSLLTLRRLRARLGRDERGHEAAEAVGRVLEASSTVLESIGKRLLDGKSPIVLDGFNAMARELNQSAAQSDGGLLGAAIRDALQQTDALAGQLRTAVRLTSGSVVAEAQTDRGISWRRRFYGRLAKLRANLSPHSTAFRHAIRLAICLGIGDAIGRSLSEQRTYWIPMTIAIILRPDFTSTFTRGVLRLGGTLAGLLLATVLFHFVHGGGVGFDIAMLAVFAFLLRCIGPANYGIFVTAVSALVVLLIAITGVDPNAVIGARAMNTAAGGALALIAYWIWPTWERTQAGAVLAEMLEAYRDYFRAVVAAYNGSATAAAALDRQRDNGRRARSNAEASVDRVASEPGVTPERAGLLTAILASSHGFAHAAMAIESALYQTAPAPPRPVVLEFARQVDPTLTALAGALRGDGLPQRLPDLRAAHNAILKSPESLNERYALINTETDRIVTSLNTLREQIEKWTRSRFVG